MPRDSRAAPAEDCDSRAATVPHDERQADCDSRVAVADRMALPHGPPAAAASHDSQLAMAPVVRDSRAAVPATTLHDSRAPQGSPALCITRLTVRDGKLDIETETMLGHLHVSAEVAETVCRRLPNIVNHVCVNTRDGSERFGGEIVGTELAHLFEHIVIELEAQAGAAGVAEVAGVGGVGAAGGEGARSQAGLRAGARSIGASGAGAQGAAGTAGVAGGELIGHTSWAEELEESRERGVAVMMSTVTFADDLIALAAARDAAVLVNDACAGRA